MMTLVDAESEFKLVATLKLYSLHARVRNAFSILSVAHFVVRTDHQVMICSSIGYSDIRLHIL